MQTVILCNTPCPTLAPLCVDSTPATAQILDKTLLEYTLKTLESLDFSHFTVVTPKSSGEILTLCQNLKDRFDLKIFSSDRSDLQILRHLWLGEDMLVVECNRSRLCDVKKLVNSHISQNSPLTFAVNSKEKSPFCISIPDVTKFSHHGVYILSKELLACTPVDTKISSVSELAQLTPNTTAVPDQTPCFEIKTPQDLAKANRFFLENLSQTSLKDFQTSDGFFNLSGKPLHGVTVIPPVFVGKNCRIGHGTVLDKGTVISQNVTVGVGAYIRESLLGDGCFVGDKANVESSVLDKGVILQKGVVCKQMTTIGSKTLVGKESLLKSVNVFPDKKISAHSTVSNDVKTRSDGEILFDDEGKITDLNALLTPQLATEIGLAVGSALNIGDSVCLCHNDHPTARLLAKSICCGLEFSGVNVWLLENSTSGCLNFSQNITRSPLAVEVCSKIDSYVKITSQGGFSPTATTVKQIETNLNFSLFRYNPTSLGQTVNGQAFEKMYLSFLENFLPKSFKGLNVKFKTADTDTAKICDRLITPKNDLGGEIITFHLNNSDFGLSAYSEKTGYVFGEKLLIAVMKDSLQKGEKICIDDTFPDVCDSLLQDSNGELFRQPASPVRLAPKIFFKNETLFVKDSLFLAVKIISLLQKQNATLTALLQDIPPFYQTKRFVCTPPDCDLKNEEIYDENINAHASLRLTKDEKGVYIFSNANTPETATAFCDQIETAIKRISSRSKP